MDQPVTGLPGQVPQQHFPGLGGSPGPLGFEGVERPHVAAVRGVGGPVRLPAQHQAQAGLPNSRVADEDDLGIDIAARGLLDRRAGQPFVVKGVAEHLIGIAAFGHCQ